MSLQPFEFVPAEKNKHKFMVQSMYAPEGEIHQDLLWKEVDTTQLMDSKLKCVFVMPDNNGMSAGSAGKNKQNLGFIAYQPGGRERELIFH